LSEEEEGVIIEEVNLELFNLEERETFWIKQIKPEYNAIKEGARNLSVPHLLETPFFFFSKSTLRLLPWGEWTVRGPQKQKKGILKIYKNRSSGVIYIYDEFKKLLVTIPSLTSLAVLLGNKSITISLKRAMVSGSLFRSSWYISKHPFNLDEKPLIEFSSPEYFDLIEKMKSQKHIRKAIFVFKDGEFICKYDGIMEAEKALKISHDTINENIEKNTMYKGYRFSLHRV